MLDTLANGFTEFHAAGVQQHEAATSIMSSLQRMSELLENTSPTITEPLNKVCMSTNKLFTNQKRSQHSIILSSQCLM